ncbi:hypothetical protein B484DRAFT_434661, partial [Ochromonadaceae sp. CCMP2298]
MVYDVVCVGAGPAGLCAAIRLKQLSVEQGVDLSVCVIDKGAEVGDHILSGNVFETRALDELFPDWRWLAEQAEEMGVEVEEMGVEVYAGFAASEVLYGEDGSVRGVATKEAGVSKDGSVKDTFTLGVELIGRQTLLAEGCRGSCSEEVISRFKLSQDRDIQSYGLGIKEVWEIPEEKCKPGYVQHTLGWPLQHTPTSDVFGGTFLYHMAPNLVLLGMVVGLDYKNPFLNPYKEFQ